MKKDRLIFFLNQNVFMGKGSLYEKDYSVTLNDDLDIENYLSYESIKVKTEYVRVSLDCDFFFIYLYFPVKSSDSEKSHRIIQSVYNGIIESFMNSKNITEFSYDIINKFSENVKEYQFYDPTPGYRYIDPLSGEVIYGGVVE